MKKHVAVALVAALALTVSQPIFAAERGGQDRGERDRTPKIIKIIKKLLVGTNEDYIPTPPIPGAPKP